MGDVVARLSPGRQRARRSHQADEGTAEQARLVSASQDVELFVGAGGLSLGLAAAGLRADHLFEKNGRCCETLRTNKAAGVGVSGAIHEIDVREADWSKIARPVRLLAAGPPCQPFSLAGNHKGDEDHRNEFPAMLAAVRELQPAVVLVENVQGLARPSFRPYFEYILCQLAYPSVAPNEGEGWRDHRKRLDQHAERHPAEYATRWRVLNAADYGVAQIRTRTVVVATRASLPAVELPPRTHSRAALLTDQASGSYWDRHGQQRPEDYTLLAAGLDPSDPDLDLKPWRTVRDALKGLPSPGTSADDPIQHWIIPGARTYRGHKGSVLDWPSKTIKAGVHGVAGGENIVHLDDGTFRYFTLREMARIQGFPDTYIFEGPRSRIIGQIGNAVPHALAEAVGSEIATMIAGQSQPAADAASTTTTPKARAKLATAHRTGVRAANGL